MTICNVDVLLYNEDPVALSIKRVLANYSDITIFTKKDVGEVIPDLVILTKNDPYDALLDFRVAVASYPTANTLYVRSGVEQVALGTAFINGFSAVVDTDIKKEKMYKLVKMLGTSPKVELTQKYRTKFLNSRYDFLLSNGLTFREACILGAKIRGYKDEELVKMFDTSIKNINIISNFAYKLLGLHSFERRTIANVLRYGGISPTGPFKHYKIPKTRRYSRGYFIIPKIKEYKDQ